MGEPGSPTPLRGLCPARPARGRGDGGTGFPHLSPRALPCRTRPQAGGWGNRVPPPLSEGFALPDPPAGGGDGGTRFPHAHEQGPEVQETLPALHLTHGERKEINYRLLRFRSRRASRRPVVATGRGATGAVSPAVTRGAARGPRPLVAAARSRPGSTLRM